MRRSAPICVFARSSSARERRNSDGPLDEVDRLPDAQPGGEHRDVGDEARLAHERRPVAERLTTEHAKLALVAGESQHGPQGGGLAGAVRTDQTDDAARLDDETHVIERHERAVFLGQAGGTNERCRHRLGSLFSAARRRMRERGGLREQLLRGKAEAVDDSKHLRPLLLEEPFALPGQQYLCAPSLTYMPRPRRFSTSPSSTSCW